MQKVTEVGFEPTHLSILQLECSAIDRSAIQPLTFEIVRVGIDYCLTILWKIDDIVAGRSVSAQNAAGSIQSYQFLTLFDFFSLSQTLFRIRNPSNEFPAVKFDNFRLFAKFNRNPHQQLFFKSFKFPKTIGNPNPNPRSYCWKL